MKWGRIDEEFSGFGWKRLSAHEINPKVSNGHEFQGVKALSHLFGETKRLEVPTVYYLIGDDDEGKPTVIEVIVSTSSWYDSRENQPHRSAEWRLYYPSDAGLIQAKCHEGDLMVIGRRASGQIAVMLIEANTSAEVSIKNILGIGRVPERGRGNTRVIDPRSDDVGLSAAETLEFLASSTDLVGGDEIPPPLPSLDPEPSGDDIVLNVSQFMIDRWQTKLGSCAEVVDVITNRCEFSANDMSHNPDIVLMRWLEVAEASYRIWEKDHLSNFLDPLRYDNSISNVNLASSVSEKWMSLRQGRVSRAGTMMEIYLERIFLACGILFQRGATIENGKKPDFLFPGKSEYENPEYLSNRLRLLGSKTSFKERWRQILAEGDRIKFKHGITRDNAITSTTFEQMEAESFTVVMPTPVRDTYTTRPKNLISLSNFINELQNLY